MICGTFPQQKPFPFSIEHDQHLQTSKFLLSRSHMPSFGLKMHWSKSIRKVFRLWQSAKAHPSSQPHSNFRLPGRVMISRCCMLSLRGVLCQNWLKHALQHFTIRMLNCHLAAQPQIWTKTHESICLSSSTQVTIGQLLTASAILEQVWDAFHLSKLQHIQGHNKTSTTWNHSVLVELLRCYWKSECPKVSVVLLATGLCSTQLAELQSIYTKECCTRKSPNWNFGQDSRINLLVIFTIGQLLTAFANNFGCLNESGTPSCW